MQRFTHLHTHSEGSLIDGMGTIEKLVSVAAEKGFTQLGLTEHGTLSTAVTFSLECKKRDIKPLIGVEGYIKVDGVDGHITLLADGERGFKNLVRINNKGHERNKRGKPIFTIDDLTNNSEDVILLTGCIKSPLQQMTFKEATKLGAMLKSHFGHRMFAEAMFVTDSPNHFERAIRLAEKLNLNLVLTNDVHFAKEEWGEIHPILTRMKSAYEYNSSELWLKTREEMLEAVTQVMSKKQANEALDRAFAIGKKLNPIDFTRDVTLPNLQGVSNPNARLADLAFQELRNKGLHLDPEYYERINHELDVITDMNFSKYFLILNDIVWDAKHKINSKIGPGRGSGVGSLVLYALGITTIDPIKHGLKFERFLNPNRAEYPDVDLDFDSDTRDELIDYVASKWNAHQVATYSDYTHKILVKDLAKQFGIGKQKAQKLADNGKGSDIWEEVVEEKPLFEKAYNVIYGQIRHKGKHAGGVIITPDNDEFVPIERAGEKLVAAWTEGQQRELTKVGVVKFDLLGLTALSILRWLEEETGDKVNEPENSPEVFENVFQKGDLAGIFQFSGSKGIIDMTIDISPSEFKELAHINALYRPGPMDAGTAQNYSNYKKNPRKLHPDIDAILEETYGIIVFQEQVMEIVATITGGNLAEADLARRLFSKPKFGNPEWEKKIENLKQRFMNSNYPDKLLEKLWNELVTHSRYSFNKSHSTAYARIAFEMAWFKYHYPVEFYTACLRYDKTNQQTYIFDLAEKGMEIKPPHINISGFEWTYKGNNIYMPISAVKFLGATGAETLVRDRKKNGEYKTLEGYMKRVPKRAINSRARKGLYILGAFEGIKSNGNPKEVLEITDVKDYGHWAKNQMNYLGFVIPNAKLLQQIKRLNRQGYEAGIVEKTSKRVSDSGPYVVVYLLPEGKPWFRPRREFKDGQLIVVRTNHFNKATMLNENLLYSLV